MDTVELLRTLSEALGISGYEGPVREAIRRIVEPMADEVFRDALGNLFAVRRGRGERTVMLDAHMDEVGLVVSHVDGAGFLRFGMVGAYDERILAGFPVTVAASGGDYHAGVIGTVPPHVLTAADREKPVQAKDLFIDVGAASADHVGVLGIRIGDPVVPQHPFRVIGGETVMGKAFDDRAGCAVLVEALQTLGDEELPVTVVCCFSVCEEVGGRGAGPAAYRIKPDLAVAVECTSAADTPGVDVERQPAAQGAGPAITIADRSVSVNRGLVTAMEQTAKDKGIPFQFKKPLFGGTNAGPIHQSRTGVPTAVVSIPCRYIHAPCQVMKLSDYRKTRDLVVALVRDATTLLEAVERS